MPWYSESNAPTGEPFPGFHGHFFHSATMTFIHLQVDEGAILPEHSHPHEQVAHMLEGEFELRVEGETRILRPGDVAVIPSHAKHSGKALTACKILDAFHPVREDYRKRFGSNRLETNATAHVR